MARRRAAVTEAGGVMTERDSDFVKELARGMAQEFGLTLEAALARVRGVVTRPPRKPDTWPKVPVPDKCEPGYAVITDKWGKKYRKVECYHIITPGNRGAFANPLEANLLTECPVGALSDSIKAGEILVVQLTPYPKHRSDGRPCIVGGGNYPVTGEYEKWEGTYYHPIFGRPFLERAQKQKETNGNG